MSEVKEVKEVKAISLMAKTVAENSNKKNYWL